MEASSGCDFLDCCKGSISRSGNDNKLKIPTCTQKDWRGRWRMQRKNSSSMHPKTVPWKDHVNKCSISQRLEQVLQFHLYPTTTLQIHSLEGLPLKGAEKYLCSVSELWCTLVSTWSNGESRAKNRNKAVTTDVITIRAIRIIFQKKAQF